MYRNDKKPFKLKLKDNYVNFLMGHGRRAVLQLPFMPVTLDDLKKIRL